MVLDVRKLLVVVDAVSMWNYSVLVVVVGEEEASWSCGVCREEISSWEVCGRNIKGSQRPVIRTEGKISLTQAVLGELQRQLSWLRASASRGSLRQRAPPRMTVDKIRLLSSSVHTHCAGPRLHEMMMENDLRRIRSLNRRKEREYRGFVNFDSRIGHNALMMPSDVIDVK